MRDLESANICQVINSKNKEIRKKTLGIFLSLFIVMFEHTLVYSHLYLLYATKKEHHQKK